MEINLRLQDYLKALDLIHLTNTKRQIKYDLQPIKKNS